MARQRGTPYQSVADTYAKALGLPTPKGRRMAYKPPAVASQPYRPLAMPKGPTVNRASPIITQAAQRGGLFRFIPDANEKVRKRRRLVEHRPTKWKRPEKSLDGKRGVRGERSAPLKGVQGVRSTPARASTRTETRHEERNSTRKDRDEKKDLLRCKERPKREPPKGGGGSKKDFVPWCK